MSDEGHACDVVLAALETLLAHVPGLEDHVTSDEDKVGAIGEMPWCWIQLGDEVIESESLAGKKARQQLIHIDLLTSRRFGAMKQANAVAAHIENRIDTDRTLSRLVQSVILQGIQRARSTDESPVARLRMTYAVGYRTLAGAAGTPV